MTTLVLDDIGVCLLRQLNASFEALFTRYPYMNLDLGDSMVRDGVIINGEFGQIASDYIAHLLFLQAHPDYCERCVYDISCPIPQFDIKKHLENRLEEGDRQQIVVTSITLYRAKGDLL